ncbi:MAG: GntR family transcriptional regulator [Verrucomicrobia bacterium]|nr:GntR family transcriptional regulator [Verrucomicrobiota bacterium]
MRILKQPLVVKVAEQLESYIRKGEWTDWMPSEKHLARDFGVSRTTLRQALKLLRDEGIIETHQGKNSRVANRIESLRNNSSVSHTVAMLSPVPMGRLRQHTLLWIDELRSLLHEADLSLQIQSGLSAFRGNPEPEVEKLTRQYRASVWILFWAQKATQMAFSNLGIPTVVVGAADADVPLNTASVDNRAIAFHAVGQFTANGHKSLALVTSRQSTPGNQIIETGFMQSIAQKSPQGIRGQIVYAEDQEPEKLKRSLLVCMKQKHPPSGFLFINPLHMLTAYNAFQGSGYVIPDDVSLVSAFADQSFDYLTPKPAFYRMDPVSYADKLFNLIHKLREGIATSTDSFELIPDLIKGKSLASANKMVF